MQLRRDIRRRWRGGRRRGPRYVVQAFLEECNWVRFRIFARSVLGMERLTEKGISEGRDYVI